MTTYATICVRILGTTLIAWGVVSEEFPMPPAIKITNKVNMAILDEINGIKGSFVIPGIVFLVLEYRPKIIVELRYLLKMWIKDVLAKKVKLSSNTSAPHFLEDMF